MIGSGAGAFGVGGADVGGVGDITGELATVTVARVRLISAWAVATGAMVALVACTDSGETATSAPTTTLARASTSAAGASTSGSAVTPATSGPVAPTEPTGVPGLDDADVYCASWAVYAGTLQAIAVANAFGDVSSVEITRLEMIAAARLSSAVHGIASNWPTELLIERSVVLTSFIGPFDRRAQKALQIMRDLGATDDDLQELAAAWERALRRRVPEQPVIGVPTLAPHLEEFVAQAAQQFDAAVTSFGQDPSLDVSGVAKPLTDIYLSQYCPDLASSGVGDQV